MEQSRRYEAELNRSIETTKQLAIHRRPLTNSGRNHYDTASIDTGYADVGYTNNRRVERSGMQADGIQTSTKILEVLSMRERVA